MTTSHAWFTPCGRLAFLQKGDGQRAIADCDRALKLDPKSVQVYAIRSVAYYKAGDANQSRSDFDTARRLDRRKAYLLRAETFALLKLNDEAIADLTELITITPEEVDPYQARAAAYLEGKPQAERALGDCKQAVALAPEDPVNHRLLAAAYDLLDRHDEAITSATAALRLDPEDPLAHLSRARLYLMRNEDDKAIADANEALRLEAEGGLPYVLRGLAYADQKKEEQAKADLAEAARLDPKLAEVKDAYGRQLAQEKAGGWPLQMPMPDLRSPELKGLLEKPAGEPFRGPGGGGVTVVLGIGAAVFAIMLLAGYRKAKAR